jgi:hypothetical protein
MQQYGGTEAGRAGWHGQQHGVESQWGGGGGCEKGDREVGHAAFGTFFMQTGQTAWPGE